VPQTANITRPRRAADGCGHSSGSFFCRIVVSTAPSL
jgi:hypothetical protein